MGYGEIYYWEMNILLPKKVNFVFEPFMRGN